MRRSLYHTRLRTIGRSNGRSAASITSYVAGISLRDNFTGRDYDHTQKKGVVRCEVHSHALSIEEFASTLDAAEHRRNSVVARELVVALPHWFTDDESWRVLDAISSQIRFRYGVLVLLSHHRASKRGDPRNNHGHLVFSSRRWNGTELTTKTRVLDVRTTGSKEVRWLRRLTSREIFLCLYHQNRTAEYDLWNERSYEERGLPFSPSFHRGYAGNLKTVSVNRRGLDQTPNRVSDAEIDEAFTGLVAPAKPKFEQKAKCEEKKKPVFPDTL